jgi:cytochrome c oxidase subunit 3
MTDHAVTPDALPRQLPAAHALAPSQPSASDEPPTFLDRDPYPAEQFEDGAQQRDVATLGMWAFLAQEVLFLGALFAAFYVYRLRWPDDFAQSARELKWQLGTLNTAILLGSSFTMALAVEAARAGRRAQLLRMLTLTIGLGLLFLGIKFTEYGLEYRAHLIPSVNFSATSPSGQARAQMAPLFMSFYFVMTGFHALHMAVGIAVLLVLVAKVRRRTLLPANRDPIEVAGLYWHFVDLVWVFLFPTLYLLRHP